MRVQHLPEVIENSNTDIYAIIKVTDPDPGRHGEVDSLEIIEGDPEAHFRVRPSFSSSNSSKNEFNIEVLQLLDREISPYGYNLTLKAVDRGVPPRTSYKDVHVKLGDFNDHSPIQPVAMEVHNYTPDDVYHHSTIHVDKQTQRWWRVA